VLELSDTENGGTAIHRNVRNCLPN